MSNLPTWKNSEGKEATAVRITRMVEFEAGKIRIEHDEPHCEPIIVGKEFVEKAGGLQQEGFYVRDEEGERWASAAHFQGDYKRQHQDYDETPEKGHVSREAQTASGPELNRVFAQKTPADIAAENQKQLMEQKGVDNPADLNKQQTQQAAEARAVAGHHPHTASGLPTERALEHEVKDPPKAAKHR